jgi:hypothetical protein
MDIYDPSLIVRTLKGAPISVLWALILTGQPMEMDQLVSHTGYTENSIRPALSSSPRLARSPRPSSAG